MELIFEWLLFVLALVGQLAMGVGIVALVVVGLMTGWMVSPPMTVASAALALVILK